MINEYVARTVFNRRVYHSVAINDHYKQRHKEMNDQLILELCRYLHEIEAPYESIKKPYTYYAFDINHSKKWFRLVVVTHEDKKFLGIVNAFRIKKAKKRRLP